jgi:hypothetical protein
MKVLCLAIVLTGDHANNRTPHAHDQHRYRFDKIPAISKREFYDAAYSLYHLSTPRGRTKSNFPVNSSLRLLVRVISWNASAQAIKKSSGLKDAMEARCTNPS